MVARPDLLIADEPTGNVDPEMGARLIRLFAELNRLGTTVLIATHDRALIEATRAREMRLVEGRLVELRAPCECRLMSEINAVLPRDKGAAPLDFVIAVMAFLAALALGASLIADRAAHGWQSGLAARLTVQVMPPEQGDAARRPGRAKPRRRLTVLSATPGIAHAAPLSDAEINALVEPWIGKDGAGTATFRCRG